MDVRGEIKCIFMLDREWKFPLSISQLAALERVVDQTGNYNNRKKKLLNKQQIQYNYIKKRKRK